MKRIKSITGKLILILSICIIVVMAITGALHFLSERNIALFNSRKEARQIQQRLSNSLEYSLWNINKRSVDRTLLIEMQNKNIAGILVFENNVFFCGKVRDNAWRCVSYHPDVKMYSALKEKYRYLKKDIKINEEMIGRVELFVTDYFLIKDLDSLLIGVFWQIIMISIILILVLFLSIKRIILSPLLFVKKAAEKFGEGNFDVRLPIRSKDEIGELAATFNTMAVQLAESFKKIERQVCEIEKAHKRFITVMDSLDALVYVSDIYTYEILFINQFGKTMLGKDDLVGKQCWKTLQTEQSGPCDFCTNDKLLDENGEPKGVYVWEFQNTCNKRWYSIHDRCINWIDGRVVRLEVAIDITDRKNTEKQQAKLLKELELANRELSSFAYVVSHDLKAPLRGIISLAQWLSMDYDDKFDNEGKWKLHTIISRTKRLNNLIQGILEYSHVGQHNGKNEKIDLNLLLSGLIDTLIPEDRNIRIIVENKLPTVTADKIAIMQVFQNLISNAIKHNTTVVEPKIVIGVEKENGSWKFKVQDNGHGIEDKYFEKIFQIFQTLSPRDKVENTGVGLTITRKIVENWEGKLWLESKIGRGTTFFFTLPKICH